MEYYYSQLTSFEKKQYEKILMAVENYETAVRFAPSVQSDVIKKLVLAVGYDHPELFYINFKQFRFIRTVIGIIYQVDYTIKQDLYKERRKRIEEKADSILKRLGIGQTDTVSDKCRKIHNYFINHIHYQYEALKNPNLYPEAFDIRGVFDTSKAVCEGIAKAFQFLGNKAGIDSLIVNGISSLEGIGKGISHAWNIVKIGNSYSHIDVTWDMGLYKTGEQIRYDYFLIPDDWMQMDHKYEGFPVCKKNGISYFEKKKCLISGVKMLKEYLQEELEKGADILYFKVIGDIPEDIFDRVHRLVVKMLPQYNKKSYSIRLMPNYGQKVFFIMIR